MSITDVLRAFATVFPAELPDKTMIATVVLVARYRRPGWVWLGAVAALVSQHGLFPGFSYGVAAITGALSFAILVAPVAPRVLRVTRGVAGSTAIAAAIGGLLHG